MVLERGGGRLRRALAPEVGDEPLARDDLAGVDEQERQEAAQLLAAERDRAFLTDDLERAEDAVFGHGFF